MSSIKANRARGGGGRSSVERQRRISLAETLDRVLNKGVVVVGDIIVSVAGIDLVYIGVNLVLCSVETMRQATLAKQLEAAHAAGA